MLRASRQARDAHHSRIMHTNKRSGDQPELHRRSVAAVTEPRGNAATGSRPGWRVVFARRSYRRLWAARTVSQWGDAFNTVAIALLVFDRTGSGLAVSAVV